MINLKRKALFLAVFIAGVLSLTTNSQASARQVVLATRAYISSVYYPETGQIRVIDTRTGKVRRVINYRPIATASAPKSIPLPALPPPPVMTDRGVVQVPTPRPLPDFPVAKPQPVVKPQPAVQAPPVKTEKGLVQAPTPKPTPDFPVAKPQQQKPVVEVKRQEKQTVLPGVVINKTEIKMEVNPPPLDPGNDRKAATWLRPGELLLMERKGGRWSSQLIKTNKVPEGYELWPGRETKS